MHLLLLLLFGCTGSDRGAEPPGDAAQASAPIQTDKLTYRPRRSGDLRITATYTNRTGATVYPRRCGLGSDVTFRVEKQVGSNWVRAFETACQPILVPEPITVSPGASFIYAIELDTDLQPNVVPSWELAEVSGTYRLVFDIYRTWDPYSPERGHGKFLPDSLTVSNTFRIVR